VFRHTTMKTLQIVVDTPPLDLQVAIKAMSAFKGGSNQIRRDVARHLDTYQNDTWNSRWLETEKGQ